MNKIFNLILFFGISLLLNTSCEEEKKASETFHKRSDQLLQIDKNTLLKLFAPKGILLILTLFGNLNKKSLKLLKTKFQMTTCVIQESIQLWF